VDNRNTGYFRLAVYLFEINTEGVKKFEMIRSHGCTARVAVSEPRQAEVVLKLFLHGYGSDPVQKLPLQGNRFLFKPETRGLITHFGGKFVDLSLDPGGIYIFYLDLAGHPLIEPGWSEHHVGADLPDILLGCFRLLREVEGISHLKTARYGHHLLPDPGKGEIRDKIISVIARVNGHEVLTHGEHIPVGQKRTLGKGRGPGGVEEEADIIAMALIYHFFKEVRLFFV